VVDIDNLLTITLVLDLVLLVLDTLGSAPRPLVLYILDEVLLIFLHLYDLLLTLSLSIGELVEFFVDLLGGTDFEEFLEDGVKVGFVGNPILEDALLLVLGTFGSALAGFLVFLEGVIIKLVLGLLHVLLLLVLTALGTAPPTHILALVLGVLLLRRLLRLFALV
jgi:hypothetical protein